MIKAHKKMVLAGLVAATFAVPAYANLVLVSPDSIDVTGTGLGNVSTVLTLQSPANTTNEAGSVIANGSGETETGNTQAITQLRTFSEVGVTDASFLGIVFNPSEPQNGAENILLNSLTLSIYGATTDPILFSTTYTGPTNFISTETGTGKSGFLFQLDAAQAATLNGLLATAGDGARIGLAADLSNATGGLETFYAVAIPEPGIWALMIAGMLGVAGIARRKLG